MRYDLVIRNGQLITPHDTFAADVGINGERIAAIGHGLGGRREISARGLHVIPGAIDAHVHLTDPVVALSRGKVIVEEGRFVGPAGPGPLHRTGSVLTEHR